MKVLVIQSCEPDQLQEALGLVRSRWPEASVAVLIDRELAAGSRPWLEGVRVLVYDRAKNNRPHITAGIYEDIRARQFDLCALSYRDRFGIRYWAFRLLPILTGIPRIIAINTFHRVSDCRRFRWCIETVFACTVLRLFDSVQTMWQALLDEVLRPSIIGMLALLAAGLRIVGLHPLAIRQGQRLHGPPHLFVFIPSLAMGGVQNVLSNFLRHADLARFRVTIGALDTPDNFFEPELRKQAALMYLSYKCGAPHWTCIWELVRLLYRESPDIVIGWGWGPWSTVFTAVAGSLVGVPRIVWSLHSQSPAHWLQTVPWWQRPLEMLTARMVDRVIACSEACREDYMRWGRIPSRKIVTVHNGVDLARVRRPPEAELRAVRASLQVEGRPLVGIVGRLSAEKDHQTFLEAMRLVHRAVPSVAAIVIGKGPDELALIKATERLGLGSVVTFLGAPPEIMALLASLDVLVLSSRTEGLPTVLLEGQALGVPVVTTDAGGARETVREGETGFIVPCGDSQQLAARMIQLLQDEPLRRSLGEKGRAHVFSRFSADRMAADILRLCHV